MGEMGWLVVVILWAFNISLVRSEEWLTWGSLLNLTQGNAMREWLDVGLSVKGGLCLMVDLPFPLV